MTPSVPASKMPAPLIIPTNINLPNSYTQPTPPLTPLTPTTPCHPPHASPPPPHPSFINLPYTRLLGTGAWSNVYALGPHLAVKTPSNPSAAPILYSEASILTHLTNTLPNPSSIARIRGFDSKTSHIYLDLIPSGTLESHVLSRTKTAAHPCAPVVGIPQWLFLAERLTRTLADLQTCGVVHGDVKWGNVMLRACKPADDGMWGEYCRETGDTLLEPVLVDFSSSHYVEEGVVPDAVSAVTTSFAAPELLAAFLAVPPSPGACAHPLPSWRSDLYSVALTLLAAAVGSEVYCNAGRHVGIYVRQGNPVGWVRSDERGVRVGKGGMVAEVLEGCFGKTAEGRVGVEVVRERVEGWKRAWWEVGRKKGGRWGC